MKKILFSILLIISINAACQFPLLNDTSMSGALSSGGFRDSKKDFEYFRIVATDGKLYTNDSLKNKITFINFWFEGCAPCIAEFDALNNLYEKYKKNKDFQFLSFTFETTGDIIRIAKEYNLEYPILSVGREDIYKLIFNLGFPTTMLTDKLGKIRYIKCGGSPDKETAEEIVDSLYLKEIELLLKGQ